MIKRGEVMKQEHIAVCILFVDNKIVMKKEGEQHYRFLQTHCQTQEDAAQAISRFMREEWNVEVCVKALVKEMGADVDDVAIYQHVYLCHVVKHKHNLYRKELFFLDWHTLHQYVLQEDQETVSCLNRMLEKAKNKANYFILSMALLFVIVTPFLLVNMLFPKFMIYYQWAYSLYLISFPLLYMFMIVVVIGKYRNLKLAKGFTKKIYQGIAAMLLACYLAIGISNQFQPEYVASNQDYHPVRMDVDLGAYEPFHSTQLAELEEEPLLTLQSPYPRLDGATAFYPIYAAFTQALYPEGTYDPYDAETIVHCSTTPFAFTSLQDKTSDIIFAFAPSEEQLASAKKYGVTMVMEPIGKEAFVFFVNVQNPIQELTTQQVKDIYSGKITNWKEVGGLDEEILPYQRPEESGSQSALIRMMADTPIMEPLKVSMNMGTIIEWTAEYENRNTAIGYSFRYYAMEMMKNEQVKLLKIDGVYPDVASIANGTYPFIDEFYAIYLSSNTNVNIQPFIQWMQSSQGQKLVEASGYIGN